MQWIKWQASDTSSLSALCKEYLTSKLEVGTETQQWKHPTLPSIKCHICLNLLHPKYSANPNYNFIFIAVIM
jgi:hypothetical protein